MSTNDGFDTPGNPNWREPNDRDAHEHDDNALHDWSLNGDEPVGDSLFSEETRDDARTDGASTEGASAGGASAAGALGTDADTHAEDAAGEATAAHDFGTPTEALATSTSKEPDPGAQEPRTYTGDLGAAPIGVAGDRGVRPEPMSTSQAAASDEGLVPSTTTGTEKPTHRRTIMIVVIALVLILIAGAIWFFADRNAKAARGDELASEYQQQLEAFNTTWTPEAVGAVVNFDATRLITLGNGDFFNTPQEVLDEVCPQVTAAQDALNALSAAKMPTLGEANGADLSDRYQQAQATAAGLSAKQQAAEALVTSGPEKFTLASELCANMGAYTAAYAQYVANYDAKMQPARTVANGASVTADNIVFPCTNDLGCMDVTSAEGRTAYADGVDASYTKFFTDLAALFRDQCAAAEFEPACSAAVANTEATAAKFRDATQYLRTATPTFAVGQVPLAEWEAKWNDAAASATQLRVDFVTGFQALDPAVDSVDAMLQSVQNMLKTNQDELQALVAAVNA